MGKAVKLRFFVKAGIIPILMLCLFSFNDLSGQAFLEDPVFERHERVTRLRLPRSQHPVWGLEDPGGSQISIRQGEIWLAKSFSIILISFKNDGLISQFWLPEDIYPAAIESLYLSSRFAWLGLSDGKILSRDLITGDWRSYQLPQVGPISLLTAGGSLLAFPQIPTGKAYYYHEEKDAFLEYFYLPDRLSLIMRQFCFFKGDWFLGSDLGLFRVLRPGTDNLIWEMSGTRNGLSGMIIHDLVPAGDELLLATSPSQYPRIARNIRLTSYGDFAYQYFQGRWERLLADKTDGLEHFLEINAENNRFAKNGLWAYDEKLDEAIQIHGAEDEFFRIIPHQENSWFAAGATGVYSLIKEDNRYQARKIVNLPSLWVRDIKINQGVLYVLSGRSLYAIETTSKKTQDLPDGDKVENQDARQAKYASEEEAFIHQIGQWLKSK